MDKMEILKAAAVKVAADVKMGIPLQRAFAGALDEIEALRPAVPWSVIAEALAVAGVVGRSGQLVSETYVRDLYSRAASKRRQAGYQAAARVRGEPLSTPARPAVKGGAAPLDNPPEAPKGAKVPRGGSGVTDDPVAKAFAPKGAPRGFGAKVDAPSAIEILTGRKPHRD